jgi:hypothetical protein
MNVIEVDDNKYGHCYMLTEKEYYEYQCLKEKAREWNSILCDAKETIKSMRRNRL